MNLQRWKFLEALVNALITNNVEYEEIDVSDYNDYFKVTIKMKEGKE